MSEWDLYSELKQRQTALDLSIKQLRKSGTAYAEAERKYKIALRQKALILRDADMAVGMINLTVYGEQDVADLRYERDVAEAVYKANMEAINATKLAIRIIEGQLNREWSNTHD